MSLTLARHPWRVLGVLLTLAAVLLTLGYAISTITDDE